MRRFLTLLFLLISVSITQAQSDTIGEGWEIVERCIEEPTIPPDDWSFDGIVFLSSTVGIHGINAEFSTPYIIAFKNSNDIYSYSASLSPDGKWLAIPAGLAERKSLLTWLYHVDRILIYSTDGHRSLSVIPVSSELSFWGSGVYHGDDVDTPIWISNEEFIYPQSGAENQTDIIYTYNLSMDEIREYEGAIVPESQSIGSPDFIGYDDERIQLAQQLSSGGIWNLIDNPYSSIFAILVNETLFIVNPDTRTLTDLCIEATSIGFAQNNEFVISTGEEILLIQGDIAYRLAYHDGRVFDWRFPD